ncbi:MAG: hypothetical protein AB7U82_33300 [Blastocatellales bacterium]
MNTITLVFEDLCAIFASKLPRQLMVGLIDNKATSESVPEDDVHQPSIVIREVGGDLVKQYQSFDQINGNIFLDLDRGSASHLLSEQTVGDGLRHPFKHLVDIEKELYPGMALDVNANGCRAKLHFRDGLLYTTGKLFNVKFADPNGSQKQPNNPSLKAAISCGLDVVVPDGGRAELYFGNGIEGFEFENGKSYKVSVTNKAPSTHRGHFQYFYGILGKKPSSMLVPDKFYETSDEGEGPETGDPACMIGGFGGTDYQVEPPHLDW